MSTILRTPTHSFLMFIQKLPLWHLRRSLVNIRKFHFANSYISSSRRVVSSARFTLENWISQGMKLTFASRTRNWPETFSRQFVSICFSPTNLEMCTLNWNSPRNGGVPVALVVSSFLKRSFSLCYCLAKLSFFGKVY